MSKEKESFKPSRSMSGDDAKAEHDDIQREIAAKRGVKWEGDEATPETKEETEEEPEDVKDEEKPDAPEKDAEKPETDDDDDAEDPDLVDPDPEDPTPPRKKSLLGKYQSEKTKRIETENSLKEAQKKIDTLTHDLNRATTVDQMKEKVKVYAEKHGISEEAALDMVLLIKGAVEPDDATRTVLKESKALIQENKAKQEFASEYDELLSDIPEAADKREELRKAAYQPENLNKSLFEVFHRMSRTAPAKKKTGEPSRGAPGRDVTEKSFDVAKVAERVRSGEKGSMDGLTGEQQDQVFDYLDKDGSRYKK